MATHRRAAYPEASPLYVADPPFGAGTVVALRESEFQNLVALSGPFQLSRALDTLKELVKRSGARREPALDLARQRIAQLQAQLGT